SGADAFLGFGLRKWGAWASSLLSNGPVPPCRRAGVFGRKGALNRNENHSYSQIWPSCRRRVARVAERGDRGLGRSARCSGQASFHAGDLSWPAALEDCAALGPLA